jgi:hypothetical protein
MTEVAAADAGASSVIQARFNAGPAHVYALLPQRIAALRLAASGTRAPGYVSFMLKVVDSSDTAFQGPIPVEVRLIDPSGVEHERIYRAAGDAYYGRLKIGMSDPAGAWTVAARELISGRGGSVSVQVSANPGMAPGFGAVGGAVVVRPSAFAHFNDPPDSGVFAHSKDVWVLLDSRQTGLAALADKTAQALGKMGYSAQVKAVGKESDIQEIALNRNGYTPEEKDIIAAIDRGDVIGRRPDYRKDWGAINENQEYGPRYIIPRRLILLGNPKDNRFIDDIRQWNLLARQVTPNYPGAGRSEVDYIYSPFYSGYDAIVVLGNDTAGLDAGVSAALAALRAPKSPAQVQPPSVADLGDGIAVTAIRRDPPALNGPMATTLSPLASGCIVTTDSAGGNFLRFDASGNRVLTAQTGTGMFPDASGLAGTSAWAATCSSSYDPQLNVFGTDGKLTYTVKDPAAAVSYTSPNSGGVVVIASQLALTGYSVKSAQSAWTIDLSKLSGKTAGVLAPTDGHVVVLLVDDGSEKLIGFDPTSSGQLWSYDVPGKIVDWRLSADGKHIAFTTEGGDLVELDDQGRLIADLKTGATKETMSAPGEPGCHLAVSPDGGLAAVTADWLDTTARLIALPSGEQRTVALPAGVRSLAFSVDGKQLAAGCWDGSVVLIDVDKLDTKHVDVGGGALVGYGGGTLYYATTNGGAGAIDPAVAKLLWSASTAP